MKTETKVIIVVFSIVGWLAVFSVAYLLYLVEWQENEIGSYTFGDTGYELTILQIGDPDWPFGYAHCRMDFTRGEEIVSAQCVDIDNDGAPAASGNFHVHWFADFVRVVVTRRGQIRELCDLYYDGKTEVTEPEILYRTEKEDEETACDKAAGILDLEFPSDARGEYAYDGRKKWLASKNVLIRIDLYGDETVRQQIEEKGTWKPLPMPEDFRTLTEMVGDGWCGETDEDIGDGYWFFLDRHKDAVDRGDPHAAIGREELDFIAAVYFERYKTIVLYIFAK